jgi:tetratricopeptide (TPR) repeat protein
MVLLLVASATGAWLWRRPSDRAPATALGIGLLAPIAPALPLALAAYAPTLVAERYLYLPSVALCLGFGGLVAAAGDGRWKVPTWAATGLLLGSFSFLTWTQAGTWTTEVGFWQAAARGENATSGYVLTNLGSAYFERRRDAEAIEAFTRALAPGVTHLDNSREKAAHDLGAVYVLLAVDALNAGRPSVAHDLAGRALQWMEPARSALPDQPSVPRNIAAALLVRAVVAISLGQPFPEGDRLRLREALRMASALDPRNPQTVSLQTQWQALEPKLPSGAR